VIPLVGVALCMLTPLASSTAQAAPLPDSWCGPGESTVDLPDAVAGVQIHVIYAYAADMPDRFDSWASRIARDLAGVDAWWQTQDPTRTPRFDFADFPSCSSTFGQLDISTLPLKNPTEAYTPADPGSLIDRVLAEVPSSVGKVDLLYLDLPLAAGVTACGYTHYLSLPPAPPEGTSLVFLQPSSAGCLLGGVGSGNGWPAQAAAHELSHMMTGRLRDAPHSCPEDPGHICEFGADILAGAGKASYRSLSQAVLDPDHDDYYGHGLPNRWDMRNSALLRHLDAPQYALNVSIGERGGGHVVSNLPAIDCPARCDAVLDTGTTVVLTATPAAGYAFASWSGDCEGSSTACSTTVDSTASATATFVPTKQVKVRVRGAGQVWSNGNVCRDTCVWEAAQGSHLELIAQPSDGATFVGWSNACESTHKRCNARVRQHTAATATFAKK